MCLAINQLFNKKKLSTFLKKYYLSFVAFYRLYDYYIEIGIFIK